MTSENDDVNYGACGGISDAAIGGLVTWQCVCGDRNGGGDDGSIDVDVDIDVACPCKGKYYMQQGLEAGP